VLVVAHAVVCAHEVAVRPREPHDCQAPCFRKLPTGGSSCSVVSSTRFKPSRAGLSRAESSAVSPQDANQWDWRPSVDAAAVMPHVLAEAVRVVLPVQVHDALPQ
jgi:hypothetical protein